MYLNHAELLYLKSVFSIMASLFRIIDYRTCDLDNDVQCNMECPILECIISILLMVPIEVH